MTQDPYQQQPYPYGQQPPPGYYYPYPKPPSEDQTLAIVSFALGLAGMVLCLAWPASIVTGHLALSKIKRGEAGGKGFAVAGLAISYGFTVLIVLLVAGIFLYATQQSR